ncbi:Phage P22-like portal protein [uncultured Caudovirales phage]|uniref:Phage P22-like portal protein n=1 Tax=uncultured Caudovirales phage TaxID=2100421 RepID=A0A6J5PL82_9CAUD|nr:Phage P22-like portal protein [uncultured Caudovirales phage]
MAANDVEAAGKVSEADDHDRLATMRSRFTMALSAYSDSREDELDDLRFMAGSPDNQWQWPADVLATRGSVQGQTINARPCLTINKLPQHVRQVTNEQRQNRPTGKVIPADDKADVAVAEIFDGMVRHIEYISDADVAYDTACDNQVTYGEGYIRLLTEYCREDSFDQDLKIGRVRNSFSVYMDPTIQDPCGSDANWCFLTEDLTKEEYERMFPNASPVSSMMSQGVGDQSLSQWLSEDTVRIAEYFYIEHKSAKLNLYPDNVTAIDGTPQDKQLKLMFQKPIRSRNVDKKQVKWLKTNGFEVLQEQDWAGKWIPVIRVVGNEWEVDGQLYVSGLVRNAKDAQRMYNYWVSQEAEMLALAPKAPFIGYGGQFEGYENQWKTANTTNWPYLEVNPDVTDGAGSALPLPQRAAPPLAQTGLIQAKMGASDDIKSTTGQYDSSLGAASNERSGRAILAREKQGDTGTYHYVDNLSRAIRYVTRQLVDIIPKIYDTERVARIVGLDGEVGMVKVNPQQPEPVKSIVDQTGIVMEKVYNLSVGVYDVCVTTGPGYMTKRQEALDAMSMLLQSNPDLWKVAGDLFIKNMDWPGAQEMAARFAKIIDPKVMEGEDQSPEMQQAKQQIEAMTQHMQQMEGMLKRVEQSMEAQQLDIKRFDSEVKAYDAETKRISAVQASMSEEQIHDIVMGTIHAAIDTGDLVSGMPSRDQLEQNEMGAAPEAPPQMGQPPMGEPPAGPPPQPEMMGQGQ